MVRSHSICFYILLTNKHNLARLLCDCFSIILCSESLVTGMAYLQLGFCPAWPPVNDLGAGDNFIEIVLPFFPKQRTGKTVNLDVISTQNLP